MYIKLKFISYLSPETNKKKDLSVCVVKPHQSEFELRRLVMCLVAKQGSILKTQDYYSPKCIIFILLDL